MCCGLGSGGVEMKRQRRREGDFVEIPLSENSRAYGRVLKSPLFAFYDLCSDKEVSIAELRTAEVIFKVWVMKSAITKGGWRVVGHAP